MAAARWKILFGAVCLGLTAYWIFAAPPSDPVLETALWRFQFRGVDPSVVALFLVMGINADLYVVLLLRDGRFQRVPGWPIGIAMYLLGSFILVPYLLLRSPKPRLDRPAGRVTQVLSSRPVGWVIVAAMVGLLGWGVGRGHASAFVQAFRTSKFVNVMTLDFVFELVLLWPLVEESRRLDPPQREPASARRLRWLPLVGPALWNALVERR